MKIVARTPKKLPTTYFGLCARHMPRPIHDNAVEMIDALAGHTLNADQTDYLEILSRLVEDYDAAHHKLPAVRGIAALTYSLDENDLTGDDLAAPLEVDRSTAYKILKGNRGRQLSQRVLPCFQGPNKTAGRFQPFCFSKITAQRSSDMNRLTQ